MAKIALFITAFFLCSSAVPPKAIEWTVDKQYDFGTVELGSVSGAVFTFKNVSNDPVVLQTVRTTCGCTAAKWTETPIEPGKEGEIRIEYSADKTGNFRKKIKVFFDAMRKPEILTIYGVTE